MTKITLQIDKDEDLRLLLELVRRLNLGVVQVSPNQSTTSTVERQKMIDYIMSYTDDKPSFGCGDIQMNIAPDFDDPIDDFKPYME